MLRASMVSSPAGAGDLQCRTPARTAPGSPSLQHHSVGPHLANLPDCVIRFEAQGPTRKRIGWFGRLTTAEITSGRLAEGVYGPAAWFVAGSKEGELRRCGNNADDYGNECDQIRTHVRFSQDSVARKWLRFVVAGLRSLLQGRQARVPSNNWHG
jgi:hypothetical protein